MTFAKLFAALAAFLLLTSCETMSVSGQTIAYNEAVAKSTNEFFLLNVLRARDRFPLYYTRTTGNNAALGVSPSFSVGVADWNVSPTLTVGGSGSNTVTLANLDDQKSMRGVLTPVNLNVVENYLGQGWQREVIFTMLIKTIKIDTVLASRLVEAFNNRCEKGFDGKLMPTVAHQMIYCSESWPDDTVERRTGRSPATKVTACLADPAVRRPGSDDAVFDNYPSDLLRLHCFQAMLRVLIGLGLTPVSGSKFTVVVPRLTKLDADNLRGIGDAITAKLSITPRDDGAYAVCTKSDNPGFTLNPAVTGRGDLCRQVDSACVRKPGGTACAKDLDGTPSSTPPAIVNPSPPSQQSSSEPTGQAAGVTGTGTAPILGAATPSNCAQQAICVRRMQQFCKDNEDNDPLCKSPTFEIATRSLDSMIYYLGESLRAKTSNDRDDDPSTDVAVWVSGPDAIKLNRVRLFEAKVDDGWQTSPVEVQYRGNAWTIPPCADATGIECDRTMQILALLNQIWGLQKEAAEAPSVPVVSVINSQ